MLAEEVIWEEAGKEDPQEKKPKVDSYGKCLPPE
jgi:hypothetical protein